MTTLPSVIALLEKATEGSRELDAKIAEALGRAVWRGTNEDGDDDWVEQYGDSGWHQTVPSYTRSLDAALTLVPGGCGFRIQRNLDLKAHWAEIQRFENGKAPTVWVDSGNRPSLPLALCIASLKAHAALRKEKAE